MRLAWPAPATTATRHLAAIFAADVAGYSRLMGVDEEGTLAALKALRRELVDPKLKQHHGRIVKTTGDGFLIEFTSVVDAVCCAVVVQQAVAKRNAEVPEERRIEFRIGINLGDVIVEGDDIYGDGVNIAARLEGIAEPGGICISEDAFRQVRDKVEAEFADIGEQSLKNIARPLRVYRVLLKKPTEAPAPALPLPGKPSIAVLPFANMSGDPEQEYFADGMVEEIITALSRIRWLFVIARNSSFTYKGQAIDVKQVGRELGVRYVLEGSVRKAGGRVRITAQLVEAQSGTLLWADRFDGSLEDVFYLQDQVAASVAGVIEPTLQAVESRRSVQRLTNDPTAYDLYLRALPPFASYSKSGITTALDLLEQAIKRDPEYGPALGTAAICRMHMHLNSWSDNPEGNRGVGIDYSRRALVVGAADPDALANAAFALAYFGEDIGTMIGFAQRAVALNPSFARGWYLLAWIRMWAGDPAAAVEPLQNSLRLSPRARVGSQYLALGAAYFMMRCFDDALPLFLRSAQEHPGEPAEYRWLAACYAHMGLLDKAHEAIERLCTVTRVALPVLPQWRTPQHRELFLSGFRLAMGEAA